MIFIAGSESACSLVTESIGMSALDITAFIVAWGVLFVIVGRKRIRDVLNDLWARPDRHRRVAECSTREQSCRCGGSGTVLVDGPCDGAQREVPCSCQSGSVARERFRSGAPWVEAWACQLDEIRSLPVTKPRRRLV